jgi:hypothetical protein
LVETKGGNATLALKAVTECVVILRHLLEAEKE